MTQIRDDDDKLCLLQKSGHIKRGGGFRGENSCRMGQFVHGYSFL